MKLTPTHDCSKHLLMLKLPSVYFQKTKSHYLQFYYMFFTNLILRILYKH